MGEIADEMIDQMIFGVPRRRKQQNYQAGAGNYMWRSANGTLHRMHDMTTSHLKNALALCERHGNTGKEKQIREVLQHRENEEEDEWQIFQS